MKASRRHMNLRLRSKQSLGANICCITIVILIFSKSNRCFFMYFLYGAQHIVITV